MAGSVYGPAFDQHWCQLCGWAGPRAVREVNYWHAQWAWACRVCFFSR
jgi:hypothetical protein